jgi:arylsulfatase A-like enzyme
LSRTAVRSELRFAAPLLALLAACTGSQSQKETEARPAPGSAAVPEAPAVPPVLRPAVRAPAREPERVAYSLIDNRLAAHLERGGGLVLAAGSNGFAKYLRFGNQLAGERSPWLLRQREGGAFAARMDRAKASVHVPLTAAQAARGTVRIRAHAPRDGSLWLGANGARPLEIRLDAGWSTLDVTLPELAGGENTLELFSSVPRLAVSWIQIGAAEPLSATADLSLSDGARLAIPGGGRLVWYVLVPVRARLTARVSPGCTVHVRAVPEAGAPIEGTLGDSVDLAPLAGKAVRLELEAAGCARALVAGAAIVVPSRAREVKPAAPPTNVLFLVLDSLRFDRVRTFDPAARVETPVFDQLAATSTLFMNHYVQGNESQVSHASMWTSMYLAKHKAARWQDNIPSRFTTLDEVAKRAGAFTAAATGNGYIRQSRGYGDAWDEFTNHIESERGLRGETILEHGLSYVAPRRTRPWFLYLGLIDTHVPLRAKSPWIERYAPGYDGRFEKAYLGDEEPGGVPRAITEREKDHVRALYDSNVAYDDAMLGRLIARLVAWGVWDRTMLIVTADHGDELWEDGRVGHEQGQDDTLIHVPLLIHYPPLFPAGRITNATEGIDLLPTIADVLGIPADAEWQGASLVPAAHGARAYPGLASSSGFEAEHGARIGAWKLRLAGTAAPALFHLATDPDEKKDLFGTPAGAIGGRLVLDAMSLLRAHHVAWKKSRWGDPANVTPRFPADLGE